MTQALYRKWRPLAWDAGVKVEAVPGPAAGVAALSMSGFKGAVTFVGFLPTREGKRRELLGRLANELRAVIIYESPEVAFTLQEIAAVME
jgi:16S rRNA (cytidine1402-2'-O)-methyltransferase